MGNLTGWHLLIILAVVVLIFGAAKLPALARSVGQSARIFKTEMKSMKTDGAPNTESPVAAQVDRVTPADQTAKL
jgi:sec-independent protein translocase protein TatA